MTKSRQHDSGKGDSYRKLDYQKWSDNWDAIFKKKTRKQASKKPNKKELK